MSTVAGIDTVNGGGYNGDNIPPMTARLDHSAGVAIDQEGNLYVADQSSRSRKLNRQGIITTIAGVDELKTAVAGNGAAGQSLSDYL